MTRSAFGVDPSLPYRSAPAGMLVGMTRLYRDFLHAPEKVAQYFGPAFDDAAALAELASRLQRRTYPREAMAIALQDLATEVAAPQAVRAQIDLLRRPDSLVVFAGQQPGLFTGPLYSIYKALTAERWAADLSHQLSVPVIPCYWLASDDHDFDEVDHVQIPCGQQVSTLRYAPTIALPGEPVGRAVMDGGIDALTRSLAEGLSDSEFKDDALDTLGQCYAPGNRFSSAFARLWYRMFPRSNLLFVSPDHPQIRKAAMPLLQRALTDDAHLFSSYTETSAALENAGYHRQVHKTATQTLLFHQHQRRHCIHRDARGRFSWEGAAPVAADLLQQNIAERPEAFSPNVLLRPIVQDALFPTLGVVLGPAETAYYAQIGRMYDHFAVPRPAIQPRTSVTLVEQSMAQRLSRYAIDPGALRTDLDLEVARVLRSRFPRDLDLKLQAATQKIAVTFEEVAAEVLQFDSSLVKAVRAAGLRATQQMSQVSDKARAAHRRREQETETQIRSLALHLFPQGRLQERSFNVVYYWARYGQRLLDELYRDWPVGRRNPLLWEIG